MTSGKPIRIHDLVETLKGVEGWLEGVGQVVGRSEIDVTIDVGKECSRFIIIDNPPPPPMGPGCLLPRMDQVVALEKAIADIGQWVQACRGLLEGLDPDQIVHELG